MHYILISAILLSYANAWSQNMAGCYQVSAPDPFWNGYYEYDETYDDYLNLDTTKGGIIVLQNGYVASDGGIVNGYWFVYHDDEQAWETRLTCSDTSKTIEQCGNWILVPQNTQKAKKVKGVVVTPLRECPAACLIVDMGQLRNAPFLFHPKANLYRYSDDWTMQLVYENWNEEGDWNKFRYGWKIAQNGDDKYTCKVEIGDDRSPDKCFKAGEVRLPDSITECTGWRYQRSRSGYTVGEEEEEEEGKWTTGAWMMVLIGGVLVICGVVVLAVVISRRRMGKAMIELNEEEEEEQESEAEEAQVTTQ